MSELKTLRSLLLLPLIAALLSCGGEHTEEADDASENGSEEIIEQMASPTLRYGIDEDAFRISEGVIKKNEFLADILLRYNVPYPVIAQLDQASRDVFPVTKLRQGSKYAVFLNPDSIESAQYFAVETTKEEYVVYQLRDSVLAYMDSKPVTYRRREAHGVINASLYQTIADNDLPVLLAGKLSDIYAWTVDFYRIQKGDWFSVVFTEKVIDGEVAGIHEIIAAEFNHRDRSFKAFQFDDGEKVSYYDEIGESLRKAFLKAPLEFSRISSRYSKKRFHPVQKRWKAHLGTDYAAPGGTPIMSTGDGTVIESAYGKYNGNYVKVRHNSTYTTQYLHMSRRAANKGQMVKQGEVIGYVGSTGLATGPHVCYRFWKNGKQIDPYSEEIPPSEPVPDNLRDAYTIHMDSLVPVLSGLEAKLELEAGLP
ncbi:MAG: M23 family metallopeptidase [Cryomorphaceae bacterium]|nr:peptidoglycan DD-metalloendopeptidase family protein [Flavobacteriales bacterium]